MPFKVSWIRGVYGMKERGKKTETEKELSPGLPAEESITGMA
jgi:hypothetical protein